MKKRIIGITGGIASGKSTCAQHLKGLGYTVIDCDKLGHETYQIGTKCYKKLIAHFGKAIIAQDGNINRKIVFSSKEEMQKLRDIVWPEIELLIKENIRKYEKENIIIFEAAILLEAGWNKLTNEIWVVICPPEEAVNRLMVRNNKTKEEAEKILATQMKNEERIKFATHVLDSKKLDIKKMKEKVEELIKVV